MNPIKSILKAQPFMLLDGGLATQLEHLGCNLNHPLWSAKVLLESPQMIRDVHLQFFKAGADVATTSSYQANIQAFKRFGLTKKESKQLIQQSVSLAKEARDMFWSETQEHVHQNHKLMVAGSVGPYGAFLADGSEYRGQYGLKFKQLVEFHQLRIDLLVEAGVDYLAIETMPSLLEVEAILHILKGYPDMTATVTFTASNEQANSEGDALESCAKILNTYRQVSAIGVNCVNPKNVLGLIDHIKYYTEKPTIVYPNNGDRYDAESKTWQESKDAQFFSPRDWLRQGAQVIGGCCRTTPEHIAKMAQLRSP